MSEYDIPEADIKKFKTQLLIRLANCDDPVRLIRAAAALDENAERKLEEYLDGLGD